ncbi:MAG: ribosome-associated translation inhibitor RaiA [Acidobacteria bacterium]|nr:ribosome-associated translation inhibitor RaiA [Acidobacteriota bacterium]
MRFDLTGRNVEITPVLRQLIDRRLARLQRMLNDSAVSVQVVLTLEKYRHIAEITVHARGDHMLHGIGGASNWPLSLKDAVEKISQQAHKLKDKWAKRKRGAMRARVVPAVAAEAVAPDRDTRHRIVRASRYAVKPMTIEDAALRVDSGRDAFIVFRNSTTEAINILYRRKDGHLGLIEPEA